LGQEASFGVLTQMPMLVLHESAVQATLSLHWPFVVQVVHLQNPVVKLHTPRGQSASASQAIELTFVPAQPAPLLMQISFTVQALLSLQVMVMWDTWPV
jgi:hypothetical protein